MEITDLIGKTITAADLIAPEKVGYDKHDPPVVFILLDDEVSLGVQSDEEGNSPGVLIYANNKTEERGAFYNETVQSVSESNQEELFDPS